MLYNAADGKIINFNTVKQLNVLTVFQYLLRQHEEKQFEKRLHEVYKKSSAKR